MRFGVKFNYSLSYLSSDSDARVWHQNTSYPYSVFGDGIGFGAGLVASYHLTDKIYMNAEILYAANEISMTQSDHVEVNREYKNNESALSIQLVAMYNVIKPRPISPYLEAGLRSDIVFMSDYDKRTGSDAGVVFGAGLTVRVWQLTGYLGYRGALNVTNFDKDGHAGMFIQHSGGLTVLY
ncbi:MAG: PorT family protein [Chitinispirillales bacterium]|nr:PorT family protein [Chitinispirillales bacterium]